MKPTPRLQRYAFYHCANGRRKLMAVYNVPDEVAGWVRLGDNFPNHESEEWVCKHCGWANSGPEAA